MKNLVHEKNLFKSLLLFSIPLIIANLLQQSYNIVDLIIAGKVIGSDALSATSCTTTFIQFLSSLFWGFGVAVSTIVGQYYGANEKEKIVKVIKDVFLFVTISMLILCGLCVIFSTQILQLLKVDSEIFDSANNYFRLFMIALFIQAITYQIISMQHGLGNSRFPMIMTMVSGIGNVLLNLLFVAKLGLGVEGLAYATIISSFIALIMGIIVSFKSIKDLDGNFKLEFSFNTLKPVMILAVPCIIQQCALYLSSVIVQPYINGMGKAYSAGYGVAMNVNLIFNAVFHALSRGTATYTSQSLGAKEYDNYSKGIKVGTILQIALVTPMMIATLIFPRQIFSIFLKNNDASCLDYAVTYAYWCVPFMFFLCYGNLMHSFYKSVHASKTVVITTALFTVARIALTYLLPENGSLSSVYLGLSLSWVIEAAIIFGIYMSGLWKTKEHKEYEANKKLSAE